MLQDTQTQNEVMETSLSAETTTVNTNDIIAPTSSSISQEANPPSQSNKEDPYLYRPDYEKMTEDERLLAPVVTKSTSIAYWQQTLGLAQITKMRGNMWRKVGFTVNTTNFLYPEEALYLFEKGALAITKTQHGHDFMNKQEIYDIIMQVIPIACYMTYRRLKVCIYNFYYID